MPTAISIDEQNRLYIAETHRFARGVEDNRRNGHWLRDDIGSTSTADRLATYQKHASKKPIEYYTRYSEKIRRIEDRDGDGKCDFGQVYAEGFNDPLDGTAAGIMAFNGKVYLPAYPMSGYWRMSTTMVLPTSASRSRKALVLVSASAVMTSMVWSLVRMAGFILPSVTVRTT